MDQAVRSPADMIGGDDQAERIIRLVQDEPREQQEASLRQLFDAHKSAFGGSVEEFLARVRRHPHWKLVQIINRDEQAERIVAHIDETETLWPARHELCRRLFVASGGRLGPDFGQFWTRLARTPAWRAKEVSIPLEVIQDGLPKDAAKLLERTRCVTARDLLANWTEAKIANLEEGPTSCGGSEAMRQIRTRLAALGLKLPKN